MVFRLDPCPAAANGRTSIPGMKVFSAILALLVVVLCGRAEALDPGRHLTQLHHTRWTIEDGAPPDIWSLAQSPDGYLWLGTGAGLYRFDGVRFEKFVLPPGERLPSSNITALFADPSGDLWIGFVSGNIARLHRGRLTTFDPGMPNASVFQITADRTGTVWAALRSQQHGGVVRFAQGRWTVAGASFGLPTGNATSILAARDGAIWVNLAGALYVMRRGTQRFAATGDRLRLISCIVEDARGGIWVSSDEDGRPRLVSGGTSPKSHAPTSLLRPPLAPDAETGRMIIDRDGALWGTYQVGGVFRLAGAVDSPRGGRLAERFSLADGLSSDIARPLLEDREGNVWVGTNLGLDRFRATNAVAAPGIPTTSRQGYLVTAVPGGTVYVATGDTLYRIDPGEPARRVANMPSVPTFLYTGLQGTVWVGLEHGLGRLDHDRFTIVPLPAAATEMTVGWSQAPDGGICISVLRAGIFCGKGSNWHPGGLPLDAAHASPWQMLRDRAGRLWLNYDNELGMIDHGKLRRFSGRDGLTIGKIGIVADGDAGVLVGGDFGLARFDGHKFVTLDAERHPVLSRLSGIVTTKAGDTWLNGINGVIRISAADLMSAFARPGGTFNYALYDMKDGLPGVAQQDSDTPTAIEGTDGRLWFVTSHGVAWLDPRHLVRNLVPPPVSIRSLITEGAEYRYPGLVTLPAGSSNLEIDFTALSLSIPERVQFRYKLSGVNADWVDPGSRRQAFYTNLGPGSYRFQVIAANNDGVWNRSGATITITIPPTFLQSIWFKLLLLAIGIVIAWLLYSLRVRQITDRLRGRLEERLGERERIARELHDTLLQGFQGLVFRFQGAIGRLQPENPVRDMMERALDQADELLIEGRNRVLDLRAGHADADLSEIVAHAAERIMAASAASFRIIVEGKPRRLHAIVQEEVSRIAEEALSNAARHAKAESVEISIGYRSADFALHVRDNGIGMNPKALAAAGPRGHFGIIGMRERAVKIGGVLAVSSSPAAGTEITLVVPATTAYARTPVRRRLFAARRSRAEVN
jgi:signal transduction histidine kinase/ligand-binding sensor domain-containing protein